MYRNYFCCLLLLLVVLAGWGQSTIRRELRADTGTFYFRFSPLGMIDMFDGNVTLGSEYRLNDTWAVTLDAGYIMYSAYRSAKRTTGFIFRPGIRVYPTRWKDFFIDLQFHYKNVTYRINDWLEKDVVADVASYEEYKVFKYRKQVIGGNISAGVRNYFTNNRRFYIEGYFGVGIHYKDEGIHNEPNSRYDRGLRLFNDRDDGKYVLPALPAGLRIVYLLR
jgi:hypothetical protein